MNILLLFPGFIITFFIVLYYELRKERIIPRNKVHFYVARDIDGELWLYLSKPNRCTDTFCSHHGVLVSAEDFPKFGLNKKDYDYLKWEDEPVEVFLNLED